MDTCEDLAFKNINELADLNKNDLLNIIAFLQAERKLWINQFTKTHNESVDMQKENQELKKKYENAVADYETTMAEKNELKKQVENYKKLGFKHLQDKNNNLEAQQKEFIKYLEDEIKLYDKDIQNFKKDYKAYFLLINDLRVSKAKIEEILQKYREIIGENDGNN